MRKIREGLVEIPVEEDVFNFLRRKGALDIKLNKKGEELLYKVMGVFHDTKGGDDLVLLDSVKKRVK